jgi:hypothetical protein
MQTKARGSLTRVTAPRATRRACDEELSHVTYICHTLSALPGTQLQWLCSCSTGSDGPGVLWHLITQSVKDFISGLLA